jgi:hypothetical protein
LILSIKGESMNKIIKFFLVVILSVGAVQMSKAEYHYSYYCHGGDESKEFWAKDDNAARQEALRICGRGRVRYVQLVDKQGTGQYVCYNNCGN